MNKTEIETRPLPNGGDAEQNWLDQKPALRPELNIDLRKQKGHLVAIVEDPVRARFYQTGIVEYHFLMLLNGKRTVSDVVTLMQGEKGFEQFVGESATKICNWLVNMNLLDIAVTSNVNRLCQAAQAKEKQRLMGLLNPVSFRINLLNPNRALSVISPFTRWLFSSWMLMVWIVTGLFAWSLVNADYDRFRESAIGILAADRWLWLLVVWIVLKVIHEAAHGIACQKYGGDVPQAGILLLLLAPLAFVNVTSSWRFSSRRQRMVVSGAGMYIELLVAFVAIIFWYYTQSAWVSDLCYNIVVMAGISTVLFNANPLMRFDGYYLLSDLLGIVNLYGKGQAWFGNRFRHLIFGFPLDPGVCPESEQRLVAVYGLCSFVWRITLSASLLLVASTLLGGAGLILAAIGGVFWIWMPLAQNIKIIQTAARTHPIERNRVTLVATLFGAFLLCLFVGLKAPALTRAPAIVKFKDEKTIRSASDGFIREVMVVDGQIVRTGQKLMRIENPELVHELNTLKQIFKATEIQARIHQQRGEISLQQSQLAKVVSLHQQINEMQNQVSDLLINAPFDGVVFQRGLSNLDGSFVKQGDIILRIADPNRKQILTSIDQEQIKSIKSRQNQLVRFVFSGTEQLSVNVDSVEPRASDIPVDLAITASAGGVLPVRKVESSKKNDETDTGFRLIHPRFTGKSDLSPRVSRQLEVGQRGTAFLPSHDLSLGGYLVLKCEEWIRRKLNSATGNAF